MMPNDDTAAGIAAAVGGSGLLTLQVLTNSVNLIAAILNILLALGGLYLLWHRIKKVRRDQKDHPLR